MRIILFNGPPRCGKDTAAKSFVTNKDGQDIRLPLAGMWKFEKMSFPLKWMFAAMTQTECDMYGNNSVWESKKEEAVPVLDEIIGGQCFRTTYRQWQIDASEKFMKKRYGEDVFTRLFIERNPAHLPINVLVSDCGFQVEYDALAEHYGAQNILLIRIVRDGCSFANDSREYIDGMDGNIVLIDNNGTKDAFIAEVKDKVARWINGTL